MLFVLLNSSAEMCAGSLAGCWILGIFANQFSGLWCPWVSFGMLGASTWASWRTLGRSCDDPGTLEGTGEDPVRPRLGFLQIFGGFRNPWVSFGMLGASTLPSWGTLGRPGTLGRTGKDNVRSRL